MQINPEILIATLVSRWKEISAEPANLETNIRAAVMSCEQRKPDELIEYVPAPANSSAMETISMEREFYSKLDKLFGNPLYQPPKI